MDRFSNFVLWNFPVNDFTEYYAKWVQFTTKISIEDNLTVKEKRKSKTYLLKEILFYDGNVGYFDSSTEKLKYIG